MPAESCGTSKVRLVDGKRGMSRVGSKKFGGLIDELLVFQTEVRIVFQKNKLKVKPERRGFSRYAILSPF